MITRALALWLDNAGLGDFVEDASGGDVFLEHMPATPDEAVMLLSTGGYPTSALIGHDEPTLQVMVRGAAGDPGTPLRRAEDIYGEIQGLRHVTLDAGGTDHVRLIRAASLQTGPVNIGQDDKGRYRFTFNYELRVRSLTAHRY